jgi:hypothetical protein
MISLPHKNRRLPAQSERNSLSPLGQEAALDRVGRLQSTGSATVNPLHPSTVDDLCPKASLVARVP